ncbi:S41 family peptidase, partial [Geitlerinema splendidum]|nr:S41 family peptidase [Geitlerinema splendidum]
FVPGVDFSKWPEAIEKNRDEIRGATTQVAFSNVINRLMSDYGLSHISLFPPSFGEARLTQKRAGIGIRVQVEEAGVRVVYVFPDSPAQEAGFQVGDLIIESDGKLVKSTAELAGEKDQESTITFLRGEEKKVLKVVRRDYSTVVPETIEWHGKVAVIKIPTFDVGYNHQNVEKLMREASEKASAVVLDLRGNGGGRVVNLQHLASFFLDAREQPMGTFIGRQQVAEYEKEHGPTADLAAIAEFTKFKTRAAINRDKIMISQKVAVLVDGASGSASEMMAAALRESRNAPVLGSRTAGAVLASLILPLGDKAGFWVQYPVTDYVTIKGMRLEGNGVVPDHVFPPLMFGKPDGALLKAVELLQAVK